MKLKNNIEKQRLWEVPTEKNDCTGVGGKNEKPPEKGGAVTMRATNDMLRRRYFRGRKSEAVLFKLNGTMKICNFKKAANTSNNNSNI